MNLQKFTLSTLTFSLVTALAVAGFSKSASAQRNPRGEYDKSNNQPTLKFNIFSEKIDGVSPITDEDGDPNNDVGIFVDAIEVTRTQNLGPNFNTLINGTQIFGKFNDIGDIDNSSSEVLNLSATRKENGLIEYQFYKGNSNEEKKDIKDNIDDPEIGIRFAPIEPSVTGKDFVNSLENIIDSINGGTYTEGRGTPVESVGGVLGLAINESFVFDANNDPAPKLEVKKFDSQSTTEVPEPSTILASLFAFGFGGKVLGKYRKKKA